MAVALFTQACLNLIGEADRVMWLTLGACVWLWGLVRFDALLATADRC